MLLNINWKNNSLQWCHNECGGVSNHWRLDGLLNCLFRRSSTKTSKLHVTGLCEGNPPVTGGFPSQRVSDVENVSIWSCTHHVLPKLVPKHSIKQWGSNSLTPIFIRWQGRVNRLRFSQSRQRLHLPFLTGPVIVFVSKVRETEYSAWWRSSLL